MRRRRKCLISLLLVLALLVALPIGIASAGTTTDVQITVTPRVIGVSISPSDPYDFDVQDVSATPSTATNYFTITNSSNIQTDQTISMTSATWEGGDYDWSHAEDAVAGNQTVGLKANRGGTWGSGDIIIKNSDPNYIYEDCPPSTGYNFGLKMWVPTAFNPSETGIEKSNTVRVTAAAG